MKYTYTNSEGKIEEVALERWQWAATYDDGSVIEQFGSDGVFHRVGEIDQARVTTWTLRHNDDPTKRIDILVPASARLIHGYKIYGSMQEDGSERRQHLVYKFGTKVGDAFMLNYVLPDDHIVQANVELSNLVRFE